jgi:5-methyltetrahydropteroyltriglutamate--homocysteine methyltransferase
MPHPTRLIPTTAVGSYSQLDWLVDHGALMHHDVPRISARDICRVPVKAGERTRRKAPEAATPASARRGTSPKLKRSAHGQRA